MRSCLAPLGVYLLCLGLAQPCLAQTSQSLPSTYVVYPVAGSNRVGDGGPALQAQLSAVEGLAVDAAGNLYIADNTDHRIRKVDTTGAISTLAGNGHSGFLGDGILARDAQLHSPYGIASDLDGNLFIADFGNGRVRRIGSDGIMRTVAGGGTAVIAGERNDALGARFVAPRNVAVDSQGNLYISDYSDHRVYRVSSGGQISVLAGTGLPGFNGDGPALAARLSFPAGLAVDRLGALYIADSGNKIIRRVLNGVISTVLGGTPQGVQLGIPLGLAFDTAGNLYVADSQLNRVFRLGVNGAVATFAGADPVLAGPVRDVAVDRSGAVYISNGRRVMRVTNAAPVAIAGDGTFGSTPDGIDATLSYLSSPIGISLDEAGNLYIAEEGSRRVRRITTTGLIQTVAGGGSGTSLGDGGPATAARLLDPVAVAADSFHGMRIADYLGNRIRGVHPGGVMYTVAGNGEAGFSGDGSPAQLALVNRPRGMALDREGNLYIADSLNHRIRRVGRNGFIDTVAGNGVRGYSGDGGAARQCQLNAPLGVAVDVEGNLYIADSGNHVIRRVNPFGVISTVAGTGGRGFSGDGGTAGLATFNSPAAVAVDSGGNLFIADTFNNRIRRVGTDGIVRTIAGDGVAGFAGDGGPALEARFRSPSSLAVDAIGNIYVADLDNQRVRRLSPAPPVAPPPELSVEVVVMNGASFRSSPVAPGAIVSLFGQGIGPQGALQGRLTSAGLMDSSLGGIQVRFDGVNAPLLFAGPDQINVQAPYSVAGRSHTQVEVFLQGKLNGGSRVPVAPAAPALFTMQRGVGQAVAVNEDGSLNSTANPAARGSILILYGTGEGQTVPGGIDGLPARAPLPAPALPVKVMVGTREAEILYAGPAPGFVGLLQINLRLPGVFSPPGVLPVTLTVGEISSPSGVTVALQ